MAKTLAYKILEDHLIEGKLEPGEEIAIKIDQTLTQDATGTMAYLQFEALGIPKVKTELSVSYIDHNTLQTGFENADDHRFLQSVAEKYGIILSKPGNGICHQLHLERFSRPGKTLLGSDSHTPTGGGVGMIAIGAGGLDVAVAMGGGPFYLKCPEVVGVKLTGKLPDWVAAKDVILEVLRRIGVKGGRGKILEYFGDGVKTLSVPERATITNMGTETGATTSIFPSDEVTKDFFEKEGRIKDWKEMAADKGAKYSEIIEIDLGKLEPLIAKPHSPGDVVPVKEAEGTEVAQVCIGSCTNSSFRDLMTAAEILKGKKISPKVSLTISPGSKQAFEEVVKAGGLASFLEAGARILECTCGPCIGMGQAPPSDSVSVRTFNRNFPGRCGTKSASVYLSSVETAVACALTGKITDPRTLGKYPTIKLPKKFEIDDSLLIKNEGAKDTETGRIPPFEKGDQRWNARVSKTARSTQSGAYRRTHPAVFDIIRGPNIKALPINEPLADSLSGKVLIKTGDDISTDHIMPAGAKILPLRSNLPAISEFVFSQTDPEFVKRAKDAGGGFIIGGENYGQGSSREHAALAPMYLGVKAVLVKSFARIHKANLINFGIVPLEFADPADYDKIGQGDELEFPDIRKHLESGDMEFTIRNKTKNLEIKVRHDLSERLRQIVLEGGLLNYTKQRSE